MSLEMELENISNELERCYREIAEKDLVIERQQNMINQMSAAIGRQTWSEMRTAARRRKTVRSRCWR